MSFLLDTNILSAHLRRPAGLAHRFFQHTGRLYTSSICLGELYVWAYGRQDPTPMMASIDKLIGLHEVTEMNNKSRCNRRFRVSRSLLHEHAVNELRRASGSPLRFQHVLFRGRARVWCEQYAAWRHVAQRFEQVGKRPFGRRR